MSRQDNQLPPNAKYRFELKPYEEIAVIPDTPKRGMRSDAKKRCATRRSIEEHAERRRLREELEL